MKFEVTKIADNSKTFMEVWQIVKLIRVRTADLFVNADNWVSHLPKIADEYMVYVPTESQVDFNIQRVTEEITMNRRCYRKTDKSVYQRKTELRQLRKQLGLI